MVGPDGYPKYRNLWVHIRDGLPKKKSEAKAKKKASDDAKDAERPACAADDSCTDKAASSDADAL